MREFLQRVESEIESRRLLARGRKILVAVSGGADSMGLLHALHSLAAKNRWKIFVTHFNHQLRGRASDADEKLVRQTAARLGLKFFGVGADVKQFAAQSKISVEMAARKLRHDFFARVAREHKIPVIALAHHADDQVELFFLRLLRGAGGEGLAGMKWASPSPADQKITLVRPLLGFTKIELLEFVYANKIPFRNDATNFSTDFMRNRIRNELLPLLQKNYQPGLAKTVLRVMEIVGAEAECVSEMARPRKRQLAAGPILPRFNKMPVAVQRKVLQFALTDCGVVSDFDLIEQLRQVPGKFVSVSAVLSVARDSAGRIELRCELASEFKREKLKFNLARRAGAVIFNGKEFRWQIQTQKKSPLTQKKNKTEFFDADKIGRIIILRHWQAGDRFQPIGFKSAVKLQDLFVNAKIPATRRRGLVLAATKAGKIFWVEGLRIGERFKLTLQTRRQLVWSW